MKNNLVLKLYIIGLVALSSAANPVFAFPSVSLEIQSVIAKFIVVIFILVGSSILMSVVLAIHNRFFVNRQFQGINSDTYSLKTPEDKDLAILSYIKRNRIK